MVRITQSASTITYRYAAQFAGRDRYLRDDVTAAPGRRRLSGAGPEREVVDADPRPAGVLFRLRQHQRLSKRWRGDDHCSTGGGQPAGGQVDHGFSSRPRRASARR